MRDTARGQTVIPKHRSVTVNRSGWRAIHKASPPLLHHHKINYLILVVLAMSVGASARNKGRGMLKVR